jgi:hypothetical protein
MPHNHPTCFITQRPGPYGSSLYFVTANWIIRCSGNSNGRTPETFIRHRDIEYISTGGASSRYPSLGRFPREGGHDGNEIVAILDPDTLDSRRAPPEWQSANGVSWATALDEIDAAMAYARYWGAHNGHGFASREVGQRDFHRD